ncbi:hypothetical protein ACS0TY_019488 [Phlomoides rotata]
MCILIGGITRHAYCWGKVPTDQRKLYFDEFTHKEYTWDLSMEDEEIYKAFCKIASPGTRTLCIDGGRTRW